MFAFSWLGGRVIEAFLSVGDGVLFMWEVISSAIRPPLRWHLWFKQMEFVGIKSIGIVALTAFFSGGVFALQTGKVYALFNMEIMVGATAALSLTRELSPVFTALMVTARACSAMAAELGSMRVTEQIDALETMAVDPIQYLIVPRVIATTVMVPVLTMLYNIVGLIGSYIVSIYLLGIMKGPYLNKLYYHLDPDDIFGGLIKGIFFGFAISIISCFQGYFTSKGSAGVGLSTTRAVVISSVTVLVMDYFLTSWILEYFAR